ncbi:Stringent starvation protein A [Alphaproteobacteria bacterium SO-S41]|nr:Stringent starvation protein A [Alphaproteobacteria bacterium SO-S41]
MTLTLHYHPLSSFCHKALIALYETGVAFTPKSVNLGDPGERAAFAAVWPMAKFPVIEDSATGETVPEATIIIDYLDRHYPGPARLIPTDPDRARATRLIDRILDLYVHTNMQRVVGDRLRPADGKDPIGVENARREMSIGYDIVATALGDKPWMMGDDFTLADCAAAPALDYAARVHPYAETHPTLAAYYQRLSARPSYARVLKEAEPFRHMFPA